ncbi:MAG TPA: ribosome small subunit-dependent GTPase A [Actinomycetota bacterium]|nr:ribosome small subunit-dependent GTPase A [Actinomycetota bacterium]
MEVTSLRALGWSDALQERFDSVSIEGLEPARVVAVHRGVYVAVAAWGEVTARASGRFLHNATAGEMPAVGDWIAIERDGENARIHVVFERSTKFSRKVAGDATEEQVLVANVDIVFLVSALNSDFNPRRIERYLATAFSSGARPVAVLAKADLCDDAALRALEVETIAPGTDVVVTSSITGEGFDELREYAQPGVTLALLGSSGVGKSTIVNALAGRDLQHVQDIRADGKGRHTTTHRELFVLPSGALIIDTPGMRELQLWDAETGLDPTFADITALAADCRFADCAHRSEPGCAVRAAAADGTLDGDRLAAYRKLERELAYLERKQDKRAQANESRKWRAVNKAMRSRGR